VDGYEFAAPAYTTDRALEKVSIDAHLARRVRHEHLAVGGNGTVEQFVGLPVGRHAGVYPVVNYGLLGEFALSVESRAVNRRRLGVRLVNYRRDASGRR
jgi:hypothetical protein